MKHFHLKNCKKISIYLKRIFFLSTMFVFGSMSLYSQCKLERIKDDFGSGSSAYTKDVTLASVFPLVGSKKPWDLVMKFMLVDGFVSISVTHQSQKYSSSLSSIYFRFQDGTVLKMESPATTGKYNTGLGYSYTYTGFDLTKEDLMLFASKDLLKFQASLTSFPDYPLVEEDIKGKNVEKIRKEAACIFDELNSGPNDKKEDKKEIKDVVEYKCSYEMDKVDGFTKKRNVLTKAGIFYDTKVEGGHTFFNVCGSNTNGVNGLRFNFCININGIARAEEDAKSLMLFDQVEILLENDEPISIKSEAVSEFLLQGNVNQAWSYKLFAIENDSIWRKLKINPVKTLRLSMNGKELWTQEIDKNYSKSIMNVINCIDILGISKSQ